MPGRLLLIACLAGFAAACGVSPNGHRGGEPAAVARARAWLRSARFEDADPVTDCRPDCREQERGFSYARAGAVEQPGDCDLARVRAQASEDFIEGCRAYGQYLEAAAQKR